MARQAKCLKCKIRYSWKRELVIKALRCPHCRSPLRATSCQWKGRVEQREPEVLTGWIYTMTLRSVGNPDVGQYAPISNPEVAFGKSLMEMREKAKKYIDFWSLGSGNWPEIQITDQDNGFVARISYNGCLWNAQGQEIWRTA